MGILSMIRNYGHKEDAVDYIKTQYSRIKVREVNETLSFYGKNPKEYVSKDSKIDEIIRCIEEFE